MEKLAQTNDFCPNRACPDYGKLQSDQSQPNLKKLGKTRRGVQRKQIDEELAEVNQKIEGLAEQLQDLPTPEEFETLERFAQEVREELLQNGDNFSPEFKRRLFELLHLTIWVSKAGEVRAEGWFGDKNGSFDGVLYNVSTRYALRMKQLQERA